MSNPISNYASTPINFDAVVSAALAKQAQALKQERNECLQRQANHFDQVVSDLQKQLSLLIQGGSPNQPEAADPKTSKSPLTPRSNSKSTKTQKTPIRVTRAVSAPVTVKKTPVSSQKVATKATGGSPSTPSPPVRRRHPAQLVSADIPKDFARVKDALFLHIRMLWGLFQQGSVPAKVDERLVKEFQDRFSSVSEVESAVSDPGSPDLIAQDDIITLREGRAGRFKIGRGLANIEEIHILYVHALLAKVGIRIWGPNLDESHDSLFNSACRITALNSFRQLAACGAYSYMNINLSSINKVSLLVSAYNHYVHYIMEKRFKKEVREIGKNAKDDAKKAIQKNRERLRDARHAYAVANKFPPRYVRILKDTLAHSDDEYRPEHKCFEIKTLGYRSNAANIFFRRLDVEMAKSDQLAGKQGRKRVRKLPKTPEQSSFTKPPIGLPLDFYSRTWFRKLTDANKRLIPDSDSVAFLPDPKFSLLPTKVPDEKLGDRAFNDKFRDVLLEPYGLDVIDNVESEDSDNDVASEHGDSIDIDQDSDEDMSAEEDLFHDEGDFGNLYDDSEGDDADEEEI